MSANTKFVTGRYSVKPYRCEKCGHITQEGTNHWGEIYSACRQGGCWPGPSVKRCMEPVPEGYGVPEPWKLVRLGDIAEIIEGVRVKVRP